MIWRVCTGIKEVMVTKSKLFVIASLRYRATKYRRTNRPSRLNNIYVVHADDSPKTLHRCPGC